MAFCEVSLFPPSLCLRVCHLHLGVPLPFYLPGCLTIPEYPRQGRQTVNDTISVPGKLLSSCEELFWSKNCFQIALVQSGMRTVAMQTAARHCSAPKPLTTTQNTEASGASAPQSGKCIFPALTVANPSPTVAPLKPLHSQAWLASYPHGGQLPCPDLSFQEAELRFLRVSVQAAQMG